MKIGINLSGIGTFNMGIGYNVQGDELMGIGWQKYLLRKEEVEEVVLFSPKTPFGPEIPFRDDMDVMIHFNPFLEIPNGVKNILYLQNAFPEHHWKGGTVGVFNESKSKYDGYIFTSKKLMEMCCEGVVVPFAADHEMFSPQYITEGLYYQVPVCFVGNDLRGLEINRRYLWPAIPFGLKLWGKSPWQPPLEEIRQGGLPLEDMPILYTNSKVCLNVHILEHNNAGTINGRIFEVALCGGFLISDSSWATKEIFGDSVITTEGDEDLVNKLSYFLENEEERKKRGTEGRKIALNAHTYEHRIEVVLDYIKEIL